MRSRRFGARGFRRKRFHVARQYRSWDILTLDNFQADINTLPFSTLRIDADNGIFANTGNIGENQPAASQDTFLSPQFALTGIQPIITAQHFTRHGEDFTIRALHGYIWPLNMISFIAAGTQQETPSDVLCRLAIGQIEVAPNFIERPGDTANQLASAGALPRISVWSRNDLTQRIWWMRDFFITANSGNEHDVDVASNNGAATWSPNLFSSAAFGVHLKRFNFRVRRTTVPCVFWGVRGSLPGLTNAQLSGDLSVLSGESAVELHVNQFLRAFITR